MMNFDSTLTNHRSQIGSDSAGRAVLCMPLPGPNSGAHGTGGALPFTTGSGEAMVPDAVAV